MVAFLWMQMKATIALLVNNISHVWEIKTTHLNSRYFLRASLEPSCIAAIRLPLRRTLVLCQFFQQESIF